MPTSRRQKKNTTDSESTRFSPRDTSAVPDDISNFVDKALTDRKSNQQIEITVATSLDNKAIHRLGAQYNGHYDGSARTVTSRYVRHIINNHGDPITEALRGQLHMDGDAIKIALSKLKAGAGRIVGKGESIRGNPTILTEIPINGYTLYVEEPIAQLSGIDLEGRTMFMTPTSTKVLLPTKSASVPQRRSEGHRVIIDGKKRIVNSFLTDTSGNIAEVNYIDINGGPYASGKTQFLFAMCNDSDVLLRYAPNGTTIRKANVAINNPYIVTPQNPVFTPEDFENGLVVDRTRDIKNLGYDAIILDYNPGDNYMVLTFDKKSIVKSESAEALDVELDTKTESVSPAVMNSERDFTYQELTARNPLQGRIIDKNRTVKLTNNGSIDKGWVVAEVLKQCESIQTKAPLPTYYVNIPDIGKNVEITSKPIEHGFIKSEVKNGKPVPPRSMINARASLDLPHILQNSIEVNRSDRGDNAQVEFSHVLIGVTAMESANGTIEYYAVRSVVEARKNQGAILTEANVIGKLHAMNAKKIGKPHAQAGGNSTALTSSSLFGYNVADLLNDVKNDFADTFSDDVYKHFGMTREYNERFSKYLLFSERTEDSVSNRSLLATAFEGVAQDEFEKNKIQKYKEKIELLDAQEHKLHELNKQIKELSFSKGPRDTQKLKKLRSEATKTANRINIYDSQLLRLEASKPLQRVLLRERKKAYDRAVKRGKEKLSGYRENSAKKQVKHKIQRVVKELNDLLLSDDKKRHVPDSLKKAVAGALDILNLDTSNTEERAAKYEKLIAEETDPDKIDAYRVTMENILRAGEKMGEKLGQLHSAYKAILTSDDPDIQHGYDASIADAIAELSETIGITPISKMSMEQMEDVYNVYKAVLTRVRDARDKGAVLLSPTQR